ncbi:MAG: hypothetical protein ACLT4C_03550 [Butyricicoccus sp.]
MATTKEFLAEILDRLSGLDGVTHRAMMGRHITTTANRRRV